VAALLLAGRRSAELPAAEGKSFGRMFVAEELHFGNAVPFSRAGRTWVVPATAWSDKHGGGWSGDPQRPGVVDVLPQLLQDTSPDDLDRIGDEFVLASGRARWQSIGLRRRLISRTAIAYTPAVAGTDRGTAADGLLYSFEALEPRQEFKAVIDGPDDLLADLQTHLAFGTLFSVGQGRSRGLGLVQVTDMHIVAAEPRDAGQLAGAARAFTAEIGNADPETMLLPITLESDMLLRDYYLLPCASGDLELTLERYIGRAVPPSMELCYAMQDTHWIGGWDDMRQLPRPPQLAVAQGSVWVYQVAQNELNQAIDWWLEAERNGLGERLAEGFGRIRLFHPLHQEVGRTW
jgi:CRISPR-associated protein Csx10